MPRHALLIALPLLALAPQADAHGVWLAERYGQTLLVYGHGGGDDPYDPAKITSMKVLGTDGSELAAKVLPRDRHAALELPDGAAVAVVTFDNGIWTERADGSWVNDPKSAVPDAKEAGHYLKHHVAVLERGARLEALPEQPLQIVPLADPLALAADADLPVRVTFDGAPLEGAEIIVDYVNRSDDPPMVADAKGEATVKVRNQGLNVLAVAHHVATPGNPDADKIGHFATLSFTLEHEGD